MNDGEGRCGAALARGVTGVLGALAVVAGATALPGVAHAATLFNGTYTAVQKSFTIDPRTGARIDQPDQVGIWIVSSTCAIQGCTARAVRIGGSFDFVFDGRQWNRLAVPRTGTCRGATVPAFAAALFLVPQSDGSLTGAVTSTVDCDGVAVDSSLPLTVTPS